MVVIIHILFIFLIILCSYVAHKYWFGDWAEKMYEQAGKKIYPFLNLKAFTVSMKILILFAVVVSFVAYVIFIIKSVTEGI